MLIWKRSENEIESTSGKNVSITLRRCTREIVRRTKGLRLVILMDTVLAIDGGLDYLNPHDHAQTCAKPSAVPIRHQL